MNREEHHLPKCIKIPRDIAAILGGLKRYIATGKAGWRDAGMQEAMKVKVDPGSDYSSGDVMLNAIANGENEENGED